MPQVKDKPTTPTATPGEAGTDEHLARPAHHETLAGPAAGEPSPLPREILIGEAGVHLVLSRLLHWGIPAHAAGPGLPYDVIADLGQEFGLVRIQVKATTVERRHGYRFVLKRGYHRTRRGIFNYRPGDFDLAAFVTLRLGRVQFRAYPVSNFQASSALFLAHGAESQSWSAALSALPVARWTPPGGGTGGGGCPACPTA